MSKSTDTMIVGAGPYGLSIASHLAKEGDDFQVVGSPMNSWLRQMPEGMMLKSAGLSTTLYDPDNAFRLHHFCKQQGIPYQDMGLPVRLEIFCAYGLAFQKRLVPNVVDSKVVSIIEDTAGFTIRLENEDTYSSKKVVIAVGLNYFRNMPDVLENLPIELCSHSEDNQNLEKYRGQDVIVLGSGSSAIDLAVLLHEVGASVQLVARGGALKFNVEEHWPRPLLERIQQPMSGVGPGWKNRARTDVLPWIYPFLPASYRLRDVQQTFGPSGGWFMKKRMKNVPVLFNNELEHAKIVGNRIELLFRETGGGKRILRASHIIAATGYKTDVSRLTFLSTDIRRKIHVLDRTPRLTSSFESSVPGLYFVGPASATSSSPIMRFVLGADVTCRKISKRLSRKPAAARVDRVPVGG